MSPNTLPRVPDAVQIELYREDAEDEALEDDRAEALRYLQWTVYLNYEKRGSAFN